MPKGERKYYLVIISGDTEILSESFSSLAELKNFLNNSPEYHLCSFTLYELKKIDIKVKAPAIEISVSGKKL